MRATRHPRRTRRHRADVAPNHLAEARRLLQTRRGVACPAGNPEAGRCRDVGNPARRRKPTDMRSARCCNLAHRRRAGSFTEFTNESPHPALRLLRRLLPVTAEAPPQGNVRPLVPDRRLHWRSASPPSPPTACRCSNRWWSAGTSIRCRSSRRRPTTISPFAFGMVHAASARRPDRPVQAVFLWPALGDGRAARPRPRSRHPHPRLRPCCRRMGAPHARGDASLGAGVRRRAERLPGPDAAPAAGVRAVGHAARALHLPRHPGRLAASPAPTSPGSTTSRCWSAGASPALPRCGTARWRPARPPIASTRPDKPERRVRGPAAEHAALGQQLGARCRHGAAPAAAR